MKKTAVATEKSEDAKTFFEDNRSRLIDTLSRADVMKMADLLLQNKCITDATYETIHKEPLQPDKVRTLYHAMKPGDLQSYLVCYEYLEKSCPYIIQGLEGKTGDGTAPDSEPLRKKARIEESNETQVQVKLSETDSGSTPNFTGWTRSKLLELVEDPVDIKHLVTSLEQRLEDREMEQLESKLQNCALKNTVFLNHKAFRDIWINKELSKFLLSESPAKFPKLAIDQFFTGGFKKRIPEPLRTQDELEKDNGECNRMQKTLTVSPDIGYDTSTQNSSLSIHDPPQEAQREIKTSIGTPLECQQPISGEAVAEDGATTSEVTSPATAKSVDTASSPTADTASIPACSSSSGAVAANGGLTNNGNPRKQQNIKVCKKTDRKKNPKVILHKFFLKQNPSTSGTVMGMEELKKIKDCISTVDCREHPSYPLLLADHCIVFQEANQKKLIEIFDSAAFKKNGQLKEEFCFKVQFHMWLLDIPKTVVLSEKEDSLPVEIQVNFFKEKEKRFQQYLHKVVVPLFAVYKKVQREREL